MTLAEPAKKYYFDESKNCAVSILLASSDKYGLGLTTEDAKLLTGFGGGMGCGSTCGCLAASIAVLGKLFSGQDEFRELCAAYVAEFKAQMGMDSGDCCVLVTRYKNDETRCLDAVVRAADTLERFIEARM